MGRRAAPRRRRPAARPPSPAPWGSGSRPGRATRSAPRTVPPDPLGMGRPAAQGGRRSAGGRRRLSLRSRRRGARPAGGTRSSVPSVRRTVRLQPGRRLAQGAEVEEAGPPQAAREAELERVAVVGVERSAPGPRSRSAKAGPADEAREDALQVSVRQASRSAERNGSSPRRAAAGRRRDRRGARDATSRRSPGSGLPGLDGGKPAPERRVDGADAAASHLVGLDPLQEEPAGFETRRGRAVVLPVNRLATPAR